MAWGHAVRAKCSRVKAVYDGSVRRISTSETANGGMGSAASSHIRSRCSGEAGVWRGR